MLRCEVDSFVQQKQGMPHILCARFLTDVKLGSVSTPWISIMQIVYEI